MDSDTFNLTETRSDKDSSLQEAKISKNQLKRQLKREKWLAVKQDRRRHIKQNRKHRLAEMRKKGEDTGPSRKRLKLNTMKNSLCKIKVVLDLSMDSYMTEKDVNSLTCQLQHSYSANRRAENPMQLYLCGLGGKTKQRLDEIGDYKGWDVHVETRNYDEMFLKESLVYLSSESPNVLTTLSEDKVYIIGGLVDHNKHKGLCHKIAEEKDIAHAQLPIAEYLDMKTRKVLAVNHVFSILLKYTETKDWRAAFLAEMPQRKQAHIKGSGDMNAGSTFHTNRATSGCEDSELVNVDSNDCSVMKSDDSNIVESDDAASNYLHTNDSLIQEMEPKNSEEKGNTQIVENNEGKSLSLEQSHSQSSDGGMDKKQNREDECSEELEGNRINSGMSAS